MNANSSNPPSSRFVGDMDWPRFAVGFVLLILLGTAGAVLISLYFAVPAGPAAAGVSSLLFLASAAVAPRGYLFRVVRNVGWFSGIESDHRVRQLLLVLAAGCLVWYLWVVVR